MSDISKIRVNGVDYNIKDTEARNGVNGDINPTSVTTTDVTASNNVQGKTFNGSKLGDLIIEKIFEAQKDLIEGNQNVLISYTEPTGYKLVGLSYIWINAGQTFVIGQSIDTSKKTVNVSVKSNQKWGDVAVRVILLFIRNV